MAEWSRQRLGSARWLLCVVLTLVACGGDEPAERDVEPEIVVIERDIFTVAERTLQSGPRVTGALTPRETASIRAEVAGKILSVRVEIGDAVRRGQVLARIESDVLADNAQSARIAVRSAEQSYSIARRHLARTQRLVKAGALAQTDLEQDMNAAATSRAQLENARAQLATALEQLESATVKSPMDGVVSQRPAHAGDIVGIGAELFMVIDPSSLRLEAFVPAEHVKELAPGMPVHFEIRGFPGQSFVGRVERVSPQVDEVTRQIAILVTLPNPEQELVSGLFADGRVATRRKTALAVPINAVESSAGRAKVMRIEEGRAREVIVETGLRDEVLELVEVVSGLSAGDRVLRGAARNTVTSGMKVRVEATGSACEDGERC